MNPLASNPRNHCVPLLDIIQLPNDPPIMVRSHITNRDLTHTGSLSLSLVRYARYVRLFSLLVLLLVPSIIVQGIQFMHDNHVAHRYIHNILLTTIRDCTSESIMLDPSRMYPKKNHS